MFRCIGRLVTTTLLDNVCAVGDQMCSDSIKFRAIGAITQPLIEWVNRPTFQQVDEIQGHGPR